jgi:hypothetical protein
VETTWNSVADEKPSLKELTFYQHQSVPVDLLPAFHFLEHWQRIMLWVMTEPENGLELAVGEVITRRVSCRAYRTIPVGNLLDWLDQAPRCGEACWMVSLREAGSGDHRGLEPWLSITPEMSHIIRNLVG